MRSSESLIAMFSILVPAVSSIKGKRRVNQQVTREESVVSWQIKRYIYKTKQVFVSKRKYIFVIIL